MLRSVAFGIIIFSASCSSWTVALVCCWLHNMRVINSEEFLYVLWVDQQQ